MRQLMEVSPDNLNSSLMKMTLGNILTPLKILTKVKDARYSCKYFAMLASLPPI